MLEVIEKLLVLQDRDKCILRLRANVANVGPERAHLQGKIAHLQAEAGAARLKSRQLEAERKKLELEADTKKQLIDKYSIQQYQTKKNDEYKALAHEIETCRAAIVHLEDQQLVFMEQIESAQKEAAAKIVVADETQRVVEKQIVDLAGRETNLRKELLTLESDRGALAEAVEEGALRRYERLLKNKGEKVIVGVEHGVCGGCHMKLPTQIIVSCKGESDQVACTNCGRILYYTRDMDLALSDG